MSRLADEARTTGIVCGVLEATGDIHWPWWAILLPFAAAVALLCLRLVAQGWREEAEIMEAASRGVQIGAKAAKEGRI